MSAIDYEAQLLRLVSQLVEPTSAEATYARVISHLLRTHHVARSEVEADFFSRCLSTHVVAEASKGHLGDKWTQRIDNLNETKFAISVTVYEDDIIAGFNYHGTPILSVVQKKTTKEEVMGALRELLRDFGEATARNLVLFHGL